MFDVMERKCGGETEGEDRATASFLFFLFSFQLINQINLEVSFAPLKTEASMFLLIATLHMSKIIGPWREKEMSCTCYPLHKTNTVSGVISDVSVLSLLTSSSE